jgi:MoaA/NifB/PqqE/SkfB family radical SAM enzyme
MDFKRIIQVEVTTACQANCNFCPRTALRDTWISRNLDWEDFEYVLSAVRKDTLVHLQGWGEPLLHPRVWDMAAAVRQKKGKVSLTTNGMLLDEAAGRELTKIGMEFAAFSLAGADASTHERLRAATSFDRICGNIQRLSSQKDHPRVHIVTQMIKSNLGQLPGIVRLAARLGADRVIASNLDCIVSPEIEALAAFGGTQDQESTEILDEVKRLGHELKVEVEIYPLQYRYNMPVCGANPLHTVVVTVSGEVAPCVYTALPVKGNIPYVFNGKQTPTPRFVYGNASDGVVQCLKKEPARSFTSAFELRHRRAMLSAAGKAALLAMPRVRSSQGEFLDPASHLTSPAATGALPPAPGPCTRCPKLFGI